MLRFALLLWVSVSLVSLLACSDLGSASCPEGEALDDGGCIASSGGTGGDGLVDPPPQTKSITLGCTSSTAPPGMSFIVIWDLTVDPGPIVGGEAFGAVFRGLMVLDEILLDETLELVEGGYKRTNILELQATVHVRSGASEAMDVVLTNEPIQRTCTYDNSGNTGVDAGPFPPCAQENDNPEDGSNTDCTGLGGMPDPENPCGQFNDIPTSDECAPGGRCEDKGKTGPGSQCEFYEFCVDDRGALVLEGSVEGYVAAGSGNVLFGWDDESTGAVVDEANGGIWDLPPAVFEEPTGPNGFRVLLGGSVEAAFECTMGTGITRSRPTPPSDLISFPIQTR